MTLLPSNKKPPQGTAREPILGSGAPQALAYGASWIVTFLLIAWITHRY
jgi:hypothetical protein